MLIAVQRRSFEWSPLLGLLVLVMIASGLVIAVRLATKESQRSRVRELADRWSGWSRIEVVATSGVFAAAMGLLYIIGLFTNMEEDLLSWRLERENLVIVSDGSPIENVRKEEQYRVLIGIPSAMALGYLNAVSGSVTSAPEALAVVVLAIVFGAAVLGCLHGRIRTEAPDGSHGVGE